MPLSVRILFRRVCLVYVQPQSPFETERSKSQLSLLTTASPERPNTSSEHRIRKQNYLIDRFLTPAILSFFQSVQITIRFSRQGTMRSHYFFF